MKKLALSTCVVLASVVGNGCKKQDVAQETTPTAPGGEERAEPPPPAERPASVSDQQVKTVDDWLSAIGGMVAAAEAAKGDCRAMGAALDAEAAKVKPLAKLLTAEEIKIVGDPAAKQWFRATYRIKVERQLGKLKAAVDPCQDDEAVTAGLRDIAPKKLKVRSEEAVVSETKPTVK